MMIFCSSCATVEKLKVTSVEQEKKEQDPFSKIQLGMTHQQVTDLMNEKIIIGLEVEPITGNLKAVETQRWHSSEKVLIDHQEYQIDEYLMSLSTGKLLDAKMDLFPLGYKDGILVAKGIKDIEILKKNEK